MLADPAIRSLPGRLGPEERRPECPVGRGRGDCDAAHEILKTNMKTIIYQSYDIIESIYQVYFWYRHVMYEAGIMLIAFLSFLPAGFRGQHFAVPSGGSSPLDSPRPDPNDNEDNL